MQSRLAAIVLTSALSLGLVGAVVVPASAATDTVDAAARASPSQSLTARVATARPATAQVTTARVSITAASSVTAPTLARLTGMPLLGQLALLPAVEIAEFTAAHPEVVTSLLAAPPAASAVSGWWALLPPDARDSLAAGTPQLVGNLDGLPIADRDTANRAYLDREITAIEERLPGMGRGAQTYALNQLHMLQQIEKALTDDDGVERQLLTVDTAWPGRGAVVVGDLQTADYVSYFVPGMFFTVDQQMFDWTVISRDLHDEQTAWIDRISATDPALMGATAATVAWIGYETPGLTSIASLDLAKQGETYLSSAVDGLRAARAGDEPYISLLAHSYGSTTAMMALAADRMRVDALVLIGSPGSAAQSVDELTGVPAERVWVGEAAGDPVANSAFYGSDPGADSYGAERMSVSGGVDPVTGVELTAASGHLGYFDAGTEAMRNMALISIGQDDFVRGIAPVDAPTDAPVTVAERG